MPFFYFDPTMILLIPPMLLAMYAQYKVHSTFNHFSNVISQRGITGAQAARYILDKNGLSDIPVEMSHGHLSDHYDPRMRVVRLSPEVYQNASLASLGVAAHEVGHAIQHDTGYLPLHVRNAVIPVTQIGSYLSVPLLMLGIIMGSGVLVKIGVVLFAGIVFFQLVTLPVEFNASNRAVAILGSEGILAGDELRGTRKVLNAAALTYVAAALTAVFNLIRMLILSGILNGSNED